MELIALIVIGIFITIMILTAFIIALKYNQITIKDFINLCIAERELNELYFISKKDYIDNMQELAYMLQANKTFERLNKIPKDLWSFGEMYKQYKEVLNKYTAIKLKRKVLEKEEGQAYGL